MANYTTINGLIKVTFYPGDASSSPINISVPGLKAGDIILEVIQVSNPSPEIGGSFDLVVEADNYITQLNSDYSGTTQFTAILCRFS